MIIHNIEDRFELTSRFLDDVISKKDKILDMGYETQMTKFLRERGYSIENTPLDVDFDMDTHFYSNFKDIDVVTAFEVLEHLFAPINVLNNIQAKKIILTIPLNLWFASSYMHVPKLEGAHIAYGHYHEFEQEQFHMLLDKTGWQIKKSEKWKSASRFPLGIRSIFRYFVPRYYVVYCEKVESYKTGNYTVTRPL